MRRFCGRCLAVLLVFIFLLGAIPSAFAEGYRIPSASEFVPGEAADEIEAVVNAKARINATPDGNVIRVDGEAVARIGDAAREEMDEYTEKLSRKGLSLNRELVSTVTLNITDVSLDDFVEVSIDGENLGKISEVGALKIVLGSSDEYIVLGNEAINRIKDMYGMFRLQIKCLSGAYTVRFLDHDSTIIDKFFVDVKLAFPAEHSEQTVYLFADNRQENWGGQYNGTDRTIEILTKYSGEYNVASPEIEIRDIDGLTEYEQKAIRFMTVRGYFTVEDGCFNPDESLTRYSFAQSLVRMFFALDNEATCTFPDVDEENYRYIAASQQSNIVEGFDDGTFRGELNVTTEQVLALVSRTIHNKNGYVYPENPEKYIKEAERASVSDWAKKEVALAKREGIYSADMNLRYEAGISRKDAAVVLYRLFMIMNNTPKPTDNDKEESDGFAVHSTFWTLTNTIIIVSVVLVINVAAAIFSVIMIRKKKRAE